MKIAYFSPLPPLKSGISDYSELVISELEKYAEVDLWVDGYKPVERILLKYPVIDYIKFTDKLNTLSEYDAIIYNMGNNFNFHKNIFEVLQKHPGIVILHDYVMHHFFASYWLDHKKQPKGYIKEMFLNHGEQGRKLAKKSISGEAKPVWETENVFNYPLNKRILQKALGVVVHSNFVNMHLLDTVAPIKKINHPYFSTNNNNKHKRLTKEQLGLPADKVVLFSLGDITSNKRVDVILKAISNSKYLSENCFYVCAGQEYDYYNVRQAVFKYRLQNMVELPGRVSTEKVYDYLSVVDICINLRFPTMGETSGSAIRMLHMGKPTIVTRVGWYDELPDDCVIKIGPSHSVVELQEKLEQLAADGDYRKLIGLAARKYIEENCSVKLFAGELTDFIKNNALNVSCVRLVDKVSNELYDMGVEQDSELINNISEQIFLINGD